MDRFDIPETVHAILAKAIEINLADGADIIALGIKFGNDWDLIVSEIVGWAFSNVHVNNDHDIIVPLADAHYKWVRDNEEAVEEQEDDVTDFDARFALFFDGCKQIYKRYMETNYPDWLDKGLEYEKFSFKNNRKYIKVIRGGSVHCFVDKTNGNVLMAASWNAPAKHARGNIFDDNNGLGCMNEYGPAYLKRGRK